MALSRTKPAMATAVPVKAFSSEITTGMSAPPMGSTMSRPKASAATTTMSSAHSVCGPAIVQTDAIAATRTASAESGRPPGTATGWDQYPCSLAAAISEPVNVTEPIRTSRTVAVTVPAGRCGSWA
jgi:hypothetical protein